MSKVPGMEGAAVLTVLRHPKMTALFRSRKKGSMPPFLGSRIEDPAPKLWGLFWWALMTFTWALWGQGHAGAWPIRKIWSWPNRVLVLSISPFECTPSHTSPERRDQQFHRSLCCALSKVLE